jgi:phosphohistidine phosphatase SixA
MKRLDMAVVSILLSAASIGGPAHAQTLTGDALLTALRGGGHVIVMRHAASPRQAPDRQIANADNVNLERQLDEAGRTTATAMGTALRDLRIPIGVVLVSPTYRALETVRFAKLANPQPAPELGDGGQSMQAVAGSAGTWLQKKVTEFPTGTNTLLVTHMPNMSAAFPSLAAGVADGEALIFGPDGKGGAALVARVTIDAWPRMK